MKKFFAAAVLAIAMILPAVSQENNEQTKQPVWNHGDNVSTISYQNVRIFKIYDQKDAYVVLYEKQGIDIGTAVLPKNGSKMKTELENSTLELCQKDSLHT